MPGEAATLALSGGLGEISGDRRTRMGHTYPLPGSMAPQGALCPKLARFLGGCHAHPRVLTLFWGRGRGYPGSQRGPVGLSGARWMEMGAIKHVSGRPAPKGALRPQARPLPGRMHTRYAWPPSQEAGDLGAQSSLGSHTSRQWIGMPHARPPNPQEPPRTPAESQGRRLARQKKPIALCFRAQKSRKAPISTVLSSQTAFLEG